DDRGLAADPAPPGGPPAGPRRAPGALRGARPAVALASMEAQAVLDSLHADPAEAANLVHVEHLPARDPKPLPFPNDLPEVLVSRLSLLRVEGLFEHQRLGLEALRGGRNVMLATGTASGKSLVYQIATAE